MDPTAALNSIRKLCEASIRTLDQEADDIGELPAKVAQELCSSLSDLAETFQGLDSWLSKSGFLPADWARR